MKAMHIGEIVTHLDAWAPPALQESYDNSGLLVGDVNEAVRGVMVSLDCTEEVVQEAADRGCNLVISHHPIVFSGLKRLTGANYVERTVMLAIRNGIALYAIHTNLDNVPHGVNARLCDVLGIQNPRILAPKQGELLKLVTFVPLEAVTKVREALFTSGAGSIGAYDSCSFNAEGTGTFRGGEDTDPYVGEKGVLHSEPEVRVETIVPRALQRSVVSALLKAHPYEEVAYDVYPLENSWPTTGAGMIGTLPESMPVSDFLRQVKERLGAGCIRHTPFVSDEVQTIAVCGGAGSFLLPQAMRQGADVFITGDFKYHQFFDAEGKLVIADVGHFESEQFTPHLIAEFLQEKFSTFAVHLSQVNTNPVHYL